MAVILLAGPDCFAALATKASGGRPRFTARLASNKALRKQQLIIDPVGVLGGSASVLYNPQMVRLVDVIDPAEFEVTKGFVEVLPSVGGLSQDLVTLEEFFGRSFAGLTPDEVVTPDAGNDTYREIGYVQIFFDQKTPPTGLVAPTATNSVIPNLPGYVTVAEDGETGVADTHALVFEYLPGVDDSFRAAYTIFAAPPRQRTVADSLTLAEDPRNPIPYDQLGGARVFGPLATREAEPPPDRPAIPLPPAVWGGGFLLVALAVGQYRRRLRTDTPL